MAKKIGFEVEAKSAGVEQMLNSILRFQFSLKGAKMTALEAQRQFTELEKSLLGMAKGLPTESFLKLHSVLKDTSDLFSTQLKAAAGPGRSAFDQNVQLRTTSIGSSTAALLRNRIAGVFDGGGGLQQPPHQSPISSFLSQAGAAAAGGGAAGGIFSQLSRMIPGGGLGLGIAGGILGVGALAMSQAEKSLDLDIQVNDIRRQIGAFGDNAELFNQRILNVGRNFNLLNEQSIGVAKAFADTGAKVDALAIEEGGDAAAGFARRHGMDPMVMARFMAAANAQGVLGKPKEFADMIGLAVSRAGQGGAPELILAALQNLRGAALARGVAPGDEEHTAMMLSGLTRSGSPVFGQGRAGQTLAKIDQAIASGEGGASKAFMFQTLQGMGVKNILEMEKIMDEGVGADVNGKYLVDELLKKGGKLAGSDPLERANVIRNIFPGMTLSEAEQFDKNYSTMASPEERKKYLEETAKAEAVTEADVARENKRIMEDILYEIGEAVVPTLNTMKHGVLKIVDEIVGPGASDEAKRAAQIEEEERQRKIQNEKMKDQIKEHGGVLQEDGTYRPPGNASPPDSATGQKASFLNAAMGASAFMLASGMGSPAMAGGGIMDAAFHPGSGVSMSGAAKGTHIASRLMSDLGLSAEQAAGIAGNLSHESGGFRHMQEINPRSGRGGLGWAQWTGPRRNAFERWASARGLSTSSDEANYGFLMHELTGEYSGALDAVRGTDDVAGAAMAFEKQFERAGVKAYDSRISRGRGILRKLDESPPPSPSEKSGNQITGNFTGDFVLRDPMGNMLSELAGLKPKISTSHGLARPI